MENDLDYIVQITAYMIPAPMVVTNGCRSVLWNFFHCCLTTVHAILHSTI